MSRIYVNVTAEEIEWIDSLREQFKEEKGYGISRQKFVRGFLLEKLKGDKTS